MTDKQKIKAEIERLKEENSIGLSEYEAGFCNGVGETCEQLLSFINCLPEESANSNFREELGNWYHVLTCDDFSMEKAAATIKRTALHFCEWKKLQLMKDAVDGRVDRIIKRSWVNIDQGDLEICLREFDKGEKVKVIIIKED